MPANGSFIRTTANSQLHLGFNTLKEKFNIRGDVLISREQRSIPLSYIAVKYEATVSSR